MNYEHENFTEYNGLKHDYKEYKINSPWRHVKTRLYFTHSSQMHCLYILLKEIFIELKNYVAVDKIISSPVNYMSHIIMKLWK